MRACPSPRGPRQLGHRRIGHALDATLAATLVSGFVIAPVALAHGAAIVLLAHAVLLDRRAASVRLAVASVATLAASVARGQLAAALIEVPFMYGLAGLAIFLVQQLRRSRDVAVTARIEAERLALTTP